MHDASAAPLPPPQQYHLTTFWGYSPLIPIQGGSLERRRWGLPRQSGIERKRRTMKFDCGL